jgi:phosphoenolpyruvate synthase/pyruvate phosphate dikinase
VYFTSDPNTGALNPSGEFLMQAQGEDVVSGEVTPDNLSTLDLDGKHANLMAAFNELEEAADMLESKFLDMQDIEFTIESGQLYILQTRSAKRTDKAALRYITWSLSVGLGVSAKAMSYITPELVGRMFRETIDPMSKVKTKPVAYGLAVGGGVAQGTMVTDKADAKPGTIFVTQYTTPDDLDAMIASEAIVTTTGGATSHAAIVARSLGKPAVVGIGNSSFMADFIKDSEGTHLVVDGDTGTVFITDNNEPVTLTPGKASPDFLEFASVVWGVELNETTSYVRPHDCLTEASCVERVFGIPAPISETTVEKEGVTESEIPEEVKKFLSEIHVEKSVVETILAKGFRLKDSCYDKDPVVVALTKLLENKD